MQNTCTICVLLLLGHVIGDFYLQSKAIADKKKETFRFLLLHGTMYMLVMGTVLGAAVTFSINTLLLWLSAGLTHFLIDFFKRFIKYKPFIVDQLTHLALLAIAALIFGQSLEVRTYVFFAAPFLPTMPLVLATTGLLCLIKPVGLFIASGEIWDFSKRETKPNESQKGAGKMIGYLERLIVFFLLLYGQVGAVGFVIAAKAVIRFPEIKEGQNALAEYYLIGTLLSMSFAFAIPLLLGLVPKA